jgi:hypothetical protein
MTPAITGGIRALSFSRSSSVGAGLVFAAVKVAGSANTTVFGATAPGSAGTNTDGINAALISQTAGVPAFTYVGANGVNTATAVNLLTAGAYRSVGGAPAILDVQGTTAAMCYDEQLSCLYVGIQGQTTGVASIIGVGVYPVTVTPTTVTVGAASVATGIGNLATIVDGSIICTTGANGFGITNIFKLKTMHTSTGMAYLIVNGNSTDAAVAITTTNQGLQVANQIWAVPLVNPSAPANVGSFASIRSGQHVLQAAAANDLVTTASPAAQVGGSGILPVAFGQSGANAINDIYVDNDAVYVATGVQTGGTAVSTAAETGLWKSQAVFNDLGQIDHWTDWQKVAPNDMSGAPYPVVAPTTGSDPRIDFAAVDSYTGHVWTVNKAALTANVTQWTQPTGTPSNQALLASAVNSALGTACYSVLDLNASVTGWGAACPTQITMFGGQEKVCFAITGSRNYVSITNNGTYTSLNTIIADQYFDYTQTSTFITTSLPAGAGAVVALGFSGWNPDATPDLTPGFFFAGCAGTAGTAPGLYVFTPAAAGTAGFSPSNAAILTNGLFSVLGLPSTTSGVAITGTWAPIANVSGMPIKIQGFGGGLHVLTRSATMDRIYSCSKQATAALLNSSFVVTASSGNVPTVGSPNSSLATVKQIYDFVVSVSAAGNVLAGGTANGVEQLLMLTNDGIYTTSSNAGMQSPSANLSQLNAGWVRIDAPGTASTVVSSGFFSDYIQYPAYNRSPQSFWFANFAADTAVPTVYNRNIQYQMSRHCFTAGDNTLTGSVTFTEDPTALATFNGATFFNQTTAPTIYTVLPVLYRLFYNDGARRFFIQKNPSDDTKYQVRVLPYNLYDYNITADGKAPMTDAVVAQAGAFYWMAPIGDTGRLMMGTSSGVISLQ